MKYLWILVGAIFILSCAEEIDRSQLKASTLQARDDDGDDDRSTRVTNISCPVGLVTGVSLDDEFGPGTSEMTRCLEQQQKISVVYSVAETCTDSACTKPYALGNIKNAIADYEITHGLIRNINYDITVVVYSSGYQLVLNNNALEPHVDQNPFQAQMESLIAAGVNVYFCQNTGRGKKVLTSQLIPGVKWVTSGVTAISDFQLIGYSLLVP